MNRLTIVIAVMITIGSPANAADQLDCLTRIIHAESQGAHLEAVAINAKAAINRAEGGNFCQLIKTGAVHASKTIPADVHPYFKAIAEAALKTKRDISNGANAWNTGTKPRQLGYIKRIAGGQVFYAMAQSTDK